LADVVERYDTAKGLGLTAQQKADLVEYLKSLQRHHEAGQACSARSR
jgi:hypothetical protein